MGLTTPPDRVRMGRAGVFFNQQEIDWSWTGNYDIDLHLHTSSYLSFCSH